MDTGALANPGRVCVHQSTKGEAVTDMRRVPTGGIRRPCVGVQVGLVAANVVERAEGGRALAFHSAAPTRIGAKTESMGKRFSYPTGRTAVAFGPNERSPRLRLGPRTLTQVAPSRRGGPRRWWLICDGLASARFYLGFGHDQGYLRSDGQDRALLGVLREHDPGFAG
jgi:hypothetical protein